LLLQRDNPAAAGKDREHPTEGDLNGGSTAVKQDERNTLFTTMDFGEMETTVSLKKVSCGTEVNIVQEGIPEAIPPEACYLGWQESLILLAQLVEAEIPA